MLGSDRIKGPDALLYRCQTCVLIVSSGVGHSGLQSGTSSVLLGHVSFVLLQECLMFGVAGKGRSGKLCPASS